MSDEQSTEVMALISAFAAGEDGAIHAYRVDSNTGRMEFITRSSDVEHPFFLALSPDKRFLYSIHEPCRFGGEEHGNVRAFTLDSGAGTLSCLNEQTSGGSAACYLDVDRTGRCVLVANYNGGNVSAIPINPDGSLAAPGCLVHHEGSSINPERQKKPYAHCIVISPDNRFAYAADLGADKVFIYRLDPAEAELTAGEQAFVRTPPGAGPRHLAFHPERPFVYVINELANSVTAFAWNESNGALYEQQTMSTLPDGFKGTTHCADVKITPSGKFLYGTNRGHDSIAAFAIDAETGALNVLQIEPSRGQNPQNLAITPDGRMLLVANMGGGNVVSFWIDDETGKLMHTGHEVIMPSPSCIMLVPD